MAFVLQEEEDEYAFLGPSEDPEVTVCFSVSRGTFEWAQKRYKQDELEERDRPKAASKGNIRRILTLQVMVHLFSEIFLFWKNFLCCCFESDIRSTLYIGGEFHLLCTYLQRHSSASLFRNGVY